MSEGLLERPDRSEHEHSRAVIFIATLCSNRNFANGLELEEPERSFEVESLAVDLFLTINDEQAKNSLDAVKVWLEKGDTKFDEDALEALDPTLFCLTQTSADFYTPNYDDSQEEILDKVLGMINALRLCEELNKKYSPEEKEVIKTFLDDDVDVEQKLADCSAFVCRRLESRIAEFLS